VRRFSWLRWLALGVVVALAWTVLRPAGASARTVIYFPGVHPQPFMNLTRALRADSVEGLDPAPVAAGNPEIPQLARVILESRGAAEAALQATNSSTASGRWRGDPVDAFLDRLQIEYREPATLTLQLEAANGNLARTQLQKVLDYYSSYVAKTPLTRVQRARKSVEVRLAAVVKYLSQLEDRMRASSISDLRKLGDAAIKANPKVMKELWLRRLEDEDKGRELLEQLAAVRGRAQGNPASQDAWMAQWAAGQKSRPKVSGALQRLPVRRQDLLSRAKLERDYYEALIKHRSLILQQSFLLTWETLENHQFELVDPVSVRIASRPWAANLGVGLVLGLAAALAEWLLRSLTKSR
jgi:hypothetical protein